MTAKINLTEALATFGDIYSPRILVRVNDYDVKVAHVIGQDRIRSRITHRHFAIFRSRSKPNSSNRSAGPVWK